MDNTLSITCWRSSSSGILISSFSGKLTVLTLFLSVTSLDDNWLTSSYPMLGNISLTISNAYSILGIDTPVRKWSLYCHLYSSDSVLSLSLNFFSRFLKYLVFSRSNTDKVKPLNNVSMVDLPLREDKENTEDKSNEVLSNAPEKVENYFVVPKVIE